MRTLLLLPVVVVRGVVERTAAVAPVVAQPTAAIMASRSSASEGARRLMPQGSVTPI